jgi:DNA-binding transcriptional LysR family regulator
LANIGKLYCNIRNNHMDRLDELAIFVAVAEQGSFVAAARRLGRSPSAVTRAVAALEDRLAVRLFNRTTRSVATTDAGARYLDLCRRALGEFEALELSAASERRVPAGRLTLTAPEMFGRLHLLPIAQDFMRDYPKVGVSLLLLNRIVSFVDEGIDLGIRIAHLPDSSLRAIQVGTVRRVLCASPAYLARRGAPATPHDLAAHDCIAVSGAVAGGAVPADRWSFGGGKKTAAVAVTARLVVNTVQAALDAAVAGGGLVHVLSYQAAPLEETGALRRVLAGWEPPPIPVHIVHPEGRYLAPTIRLFIDRAAAALRGRFGEADG